MFLRTLENAEILFTVSRIETSFGSYSHFQSERNKKETKMSIAKVVILVAVVATLALESDADAASPQNGAAGSDVSSLESEATDTTACASEMLEWCRNISDSSSHGNGISVISQGSYQDGNRVLLVCISDSTGINCTKNESPWFLCFRNATLEYKGKVLAPDFKDADICYAKDRAKAMFRPMTFNQEAFEKHMKSFHQGMQDFEQRMANFGKRLEFTMSNMFNRNKDQ